MPRVLHLTAHLGGGIGKALSGVAAHSSCAADPVVHSFVTLEDQEKPHFLDLIRKSGCQVTVRPTPERLAGLIEDADIVQLEWWNHPATIAALCRDELPAMRLLVWCHVSGLHTPIVPRGLIDGADRFLFTSPCSLEASALESDPRLGAVFSSGGFAGLPYPRESGAGALAAGYLGSLNFAKLHPRYVEFLAAVDIPGFKVRLIGDVANRELLERQCAEAGRGGMLEFRGYCDDIAAELADINVMPYLLNPHHYGTTENALLEAMALGIVPVVLDNPAERHLVHNGRTGFVVRSVEEFAQAMRVLAENPRQRQAMGRAAAAWVRERFDPAKTVAALSAHYRALIPLEKRRIDFKEIFGAAPADWFLSCQGDRAYFADDTPARPDASAFSCHALFEATKGTVFHFHRTFPDDVRLGRWARDLAIGRDRLMQPPEGGERAPSRPLPGE